MPVEYVIAFSPTYQAYKAITHTLRSMIYFFKSCHHVTIKIEEARQCRMLRARVSRLF